ncbi:MAG: FAD-dependent oxidoreductase, partial [Spirochaetota bacterium]
NPNIRQFIEKALKRTEEAKELINDLLNYELYSQSVPSPGIEYDLTILFSSLVERYSGAASEKDISLRSSLPEEKKVYLQGDSRGMEHALRNILENAVKYTPPHGTITAKLNFKEQEKKCQIQISDTGYGIPADELENIFEPFYRSIKHKSNIAGTGLGLAIAQHVVKNHNGTITVTSKENEGSTFTIQVPYSRLEKNIKSIPKKRVVIIGGVTAGPKVAARLRRLAEDIEIVIVEKNEFLSYSGCGLPSFISGKVKSPRELMSTADNTPRDVDFFETIENVSILNNTEAVEINRAEKTVVVEELLTGTISSLPYDNLVLATGAEPLIPPIPGINQPGIYPLNNLENAKAIKKFFQQKMAQDVFIIGGGLIGISTAESLLETGARVTILEKKQYILLKLLDKDIADKIKNELSKKGIKIITKVNVKEIEKNENGYTIRTDMGSFQADLIILSTGVKPLNTLAMKAGLAIGASGGVKVDSFLRTSDPNIYAVGDCAESINLITGKHEYWPLGSISTKMGRIAADNMCGKASVFHGSIGSAMFKILDLNVGRTGLTLRSAFKNGFEVETAVVTGIDRAHYFENAQYITLKIIADLRTKVILGAQGYGKGDVIAKIEVLACAITQGMTLDEIFKLDLGYSPAFTQPIDIAQTACLVLNNKIDKLLDTITPEKLEEVKNSIRLIDVSPLSDYSLKSIPESINLPLENIRHEDIPFGKDETIVLYSKTSSGAYIAYRYLVTKGYTNLKVLEGGHVYWEK